MYKMIKKHVMEHVRYMCLLLWKYISVWFAKVSKNLPKNTDLKIILLDH